MFIRKNHRYILLFSFENRNDLKIKKLTKNWDNFQDTNFYYNIYEFKSNPAFSVQECTLIYILRVSFEIK